MEDEVTFELVLAAVMEEFKTHILEFKKEISMLVFDTDAQTSRIQVNTITEGSIIVKGSVQADDSSQQDTIYTKLSNSLNSDSQVMGYTVISANY